ncbi:MAG: hypothetical protein J1E40_12030, partial [Oscillospiraceae bacterium]|nr:hypothetical protein [Oscillospiraceae bacterium]
MDQNNGARKSKSVRRSEGVQRSLIERLDSTAENNPLLWLPCVSLLAAICGTKRLVSDIGAVLVRPEEPEPIEDCKAVISDRPVLIKALSAFLAASIMITFTPGLNGVVFTEAFAEESVSGSDADGQENGSTGSGEQENAGGEASQNSSSKSTSAKSKSKKDIKITLNCLLKGMSGGNAHAVISKEHLENSADVWLVSSDASRKDAESVMMQLGENASYYLCYPFEISIYDADSKEPVKLPENGSVEIEMPIPKIMSSCTDKMKVYHVDDS